MKRFLNGKHDLVRESIDGLIAASGGSLTRLDGYPSTKVVLRSDWDRSRVAVLSGGGAGHEPAHAGFVGRGMLTGAISGEVFASPSVSAVLAAILAVTGDAGCLLVVKNYTGDRLNFGLAAERAKAMGKRVTVVIVGDDVAIADAPQPRGVAGTLFVHKIAGHHAEDGASLEAVTAAAQSAANDVRSLGLSLSTCTLPGDAPDGRLGANEAELGLGIHGEPGFEKIPMASARELVGRVAARLESSESIALLVNELGAVPPMEMSLIVHEVLQTPLGTKTELLVGPGPFMTSLDMNGFSLSVLPLDDDRRTALSSEVGPSAWRAPVRPSAVEPRPMPKFGDTGFNPSTNAEVRRVIESIAATLIASESALDELDGRIGDGDAGRTLAGAARTVQERLDQLPFDDGHDLFAALAALLADHVGGSSGVLLAILCAAASDSFDGSYPDALAHGVEAMMRYGGAKVGDRTMLDALHPAIEAWRSKGIEAAIVAAREGADRTATMSRAGAGRAAYVPAASLEGVVDPGAEAVARVFHSFAS